MSTQTNGLELGESGAAIRAHIARYADELVTLRRDLHAHPEIGLEEHRTSRIVAEQLENLGYRVSTGLGGTGVVGTLSVGTGRRSVALRADMDALPIEEETNLPYASRNPGRMHACGHDGHTTTLLGAARYLAETRRFDGTVHLIFQPAEENLPDGEIGGARRMLAEGAFENPKPDMVFGLHVVSGAPVGTIGYQPGPAHASSDTLHIVVEGRQTHGAMPWRGVDPIVIGAQIVTALQTIQSRQVDAADASVLTVGTFRAGQRSNIIPDRAEMTGTLRTYSEERRAFMQRRVGEIAENIARGMDGKASVTWEPNGYPVTVNDPALTERMLPSLARVTGPERLREAQRSTASEDFSYFARAAPGLFFWVGITAPSEDPARAAPNHSPRFRVDETGLLTGLRAMLHLVADASGSGMG